MKTLYVIARDKFMSGWGKAAGKTNLYVVPCESELQVQRALSNMRRRPEMDDIRTETRMPIDSDAVIVSVAGKNHRFFEPNAFE